MMLAEKARWLANPVPALYVPMARRSLLDEPDVTSAQALRRRLEVSLGLNGESPDVSIRSDVPIAPASVVPLA